MKRILYFIIAVAIAAVSVSACDMFKLDNFDGPNAQISGRLLDAQTGEQIGIEAAASVGFDWSTWSSYTTVDAGALVVMEQGWAATDPGQDWLVRFDGQYRNNLIFAGDYKYTCRKLPCYEPVDSTFTVKEGANKMDLELMPYCRVVDEEFSVEKDAFGNYSKLVATFKVELGDPSKANKVANVVFGANTQLFVGANYQNLAKDDTGAKQKNVSANTTITLKIDMNSSKNADLFRYNRERYLRIGAMANGNGYNSNNLYNFSKTYKISADFEDVEVVEWDEI
ncbi:MAG: DUF3823 domain-containing protein [Bacteroidales bacterium]|nr:DUF3823 domain-containing protein [Bacteroidales bacterium]